VSRELTSQYSLAPAVNLRFEPQYYESYVAFNYKTASTTFLTADEHGVLEYIRRKPASPEEISTQKKSSSFPHLQQMILCRSGKLILIHLE
jgi:hypothetical protein